MEREFFEAAAERYVAEYDDPKKFYPEVQEIKEVAKEDFISGAIHASLKPIPCSIRTPKEGQLVMFWLDEIPTYLSHGNIMIGRYHESYTYNSTKRTVYKFSTPGHGWEGTHWCELPEYLKNFKPE